MFSAATEAAWAFDELEQEQYDAQLLSEVEQEVIGKKDTRRPVRNTRQVPYRWICQLNLRFTHANLAGGEASRVGSGTLIGPRHVLTAAHCVAHHRFLRYGIAPPLKVSWVRVIPARDRKDVPFGFVLPEPEGIYFRDEWLKGEDFRYDYAVIKLAAPIGETVHKTLKNRPLGFWRSPEYGEGTAWGEIDPESLTGKKVMIAGYPQDKCGYDPIRKGKADEGCQFAPPEEQWESVLSSKMQRCLKDGLKGTAQFGTAGKISNTEPSPKGSMLLLDTDVCGGMSGGPVWIHDRKKRSLVGVGVAGIQRTRWQCRCRRE